MTITLQEDHKTKKIKKKKRLIRNFFCNRVQNLFLKDKAYVYNLMSLYEQK